MATAESLARIKPSDLPAPPQAALRMLRACAQADVTTQALAKLASHDPMLSAELLRVVNSAYFGLAKPVTAVATAVTVLGLRAVRNLVLCLAVRDVLRPEAMPGFDAARFWEESLRRAVSARLLGASVGLDAEDCFTAGLLQDFGLPVLFLLFPKGGARWQKCNGLDPEQRYRQEKEVFGVTHDKVVSLLAKNWALPDELTQALGHHHNCPGAADPQAMLCRVLFSADWMAAVFSADDKAAAYAHCQSALAASFSLDRKAMESLLDAVPEATTAAAQSLGLHLAEQTDFDDIMRAANARLAEDNLSYQELTWRLQQTLRERDRLAEELNRELTLAREVQQGLMPAAADDGFPVHGINVSARKLSGDFFDYFTLPDGRIYFALGDVSGKGVNAALLMTKTASLFRCLGKDLFHPAELVARINEELVETSLRGMFVTLAVGLYDPRRRSVQLVNAGHPPAILMPRHGEPQAIAAQAPPLGILTGGEFAQQEVSLGDGCLYLFSDGVTEGRLGSGGDLGVDGLIRLLRANAGLSGRERLQAVVSALQETGAAPRDDITLLVVEAPHGP